MKLLIATNNDNKLYSILSEHFGNCLYFALYDTEKKDLEIVKNEIDHSNKSLTPVDQIMKFSPDVVFSLGMGKKALKLFDEKNIKVKTGDFKIVKEIIENINNLKDLSDGCNHHN